MTTKLDRKEERENKGAEPQKTTYTDILKNVDTVIDAGIKESKDFAETREADDTETVLKDVFRKNLYETEYCKIEGIKLDKTNTVEVIDKIRELKTALYAISIKGKSKDDIKELDTTKKKNRVLIDLFTSPTVKNRHVWIPISLETLIANQDKFTNTDGIQSIDSILADNTTNSYIHTLFSKAGLTLVEKTGTAGFKKISDRKTTDIVSAMTDDQKAEMLKLLGA